MSNYPTKKLGEVILDVTSGFACGKQNELEIGGVPHLRTHNIDTEGRLNFDKITRVPEGLVNQSGFGLQKGDILFNNTNSTELVGKSAIVTEELPYAFSNHMTRIRVNEAHVIPEWIALLFQFYWRGKFFESICNRWVGQSGINQTTLKNIEIPLPTRGEQRRIVERIEKQFKKIDEAARLRAANEERAAVILSTALHEIFSSSAWGEKELGEVSTHSLGKMLDKMKNKGAPQKYLRNINVRWFGFDLSDLLEMRFTEAEVEKYTAVKGDVLICEGGEPGRAAIWNEDYPMYFQKAVHRVRFNKTVLPEYFLYFLYHSHLSRDIEQYFTGAGIKHFTGTSLDKFKIPLPPLAEQKAIVKKLDALAAKIKHLETLQSSQSTALKNLKQSILHKELGSEHAILAE